MATFSTNQARQIYVAKKVADPIKDKGDIKLVAPEDADYIYFQYVGADTPLRSDLITKDLVMKATLTHGDTIARYLHQYDVVLDPKISADPVEGKEYILRINMLGYASLGIENTYQKYGYVRATKNMTASDFYKTLAKSLALNFAREPQPIYEFFVSTVDNKTKTVFPGEAGAEETANATKIEFNSDLTQDPFKSITAKKLVIREVSGVWRRGTDEDMPQMAQIFTDDILVDGLYKRWGEVKEITDKAELTKRKDSVFRQLADMEYFYMGERGDKYRNVGWPYVINTTYLMDEIKSGDTNGEFGIIDIHYAYVGSNESVQKSEKDCTIVAPYTVAKTLAQSIVKAGVKAKSIDKTGNVTDLQSA